MRPLFFISLYFLHSVQCDIINCVGQSACLSKTYHCKKGEDCTILCVGKHSCQSSTIYCPSGAYNCRVNSTAKCATSGATLIASSGIGGNVTVTAVGAGPHFSHIYCPVNGECNLYAFNSKYAFAKSTIRAEYATKLNIEVAVGNAALQESNIYCPIDGRQVNCLITIYDKPYYHNGLIDTNIYAVSSWRGMSILCEDDTGCGNVTMHCTKNYNASCVNGNNKYNECEDTHSVCSTTSIEPDIWRLDLIIFLIWMSAFCYMCTIMVWLYCHKNAKQKSAKCLEMSDSNTKNEYMAM